MECCHVSHHRISHHVHKVICRYYTFAQHYVSLRPAINRLIEKRTKTIHDCMRVLRSVKMKLNTHSFSLKLSVSADISSALRQKHFVKVMPFSSLTHMDRLVGCNIMCLHHFKRTGLHKCKIYQPSSNYEANEKIFRNMA